MKNEKQLDFEDIVNVVYRYSREIEHSDQNLELMEKGNRTYGYSTEIIYFH